MDSSGHAAIGAELLATRRPRRIVGYRLFEDKGVQGIKQIFVLTFLELRRTAAKSLFDHSSTQASGDGIEKGHEIIIFSRIEPEFHLNDPGPSIGSGPTDHRFLRPRIKAFLYIPRAEAMIG